MNIRAINTEETPLVAEYKPHPWRWYVLATFSVLAFSNGINWITYAPIVKWTASFYNVSIGTADFLTIIIYIGVSVGAPLGMFVLDSLNLREAMRISATLNLTGNIVRVLSAYLPRHVPYLNFGVAMAGQLLIALAQPYVLFGPAKVASVWFADGERLIANTVTTMSLIVGNGVVMLSPGIVYSEGQLPLLLEVTTAPALLGLLMTVFGVCRKKPPQPPSPSAEKGLKTWTGIKTLVTNWQYWCLFVTFSITGGTFNTAVTLLTQFICPYGYSEWFAGILGSAMIFTGLFGALLFGFIVDKTKWFEEVSKISLAAGSLGLILFSEIFKMPNQTILMVISLTTIAFFAMPLYSLLSELAIEVSYPVAEGTCNGFLSVGSQIFSAVLVFSAPYLTQTVKSQDSEISQCGVARSANTTVSTSYGQDFTNFFYLVNGLMTFIACVYIIGFRPKYARLEAERIAKLESDSETDS